MNDFTIGVIVTASTILIGFVIWIASKPSRKISDRVVFNTDTAATTPWSPPASAPSPSPAISSPSLAPEHIDHTTTAKLWVPLGEGVITGLFCGAIAALITALLKYSFLDVLAWFCGVFIVAGFIVWIVAHAWHKLVWYLELKYRSNPLPSAKEEPTRAAYPVILKQYDRNEVFVGEKQVGVMDITDEEKNILVIARERGIAFSESEFCRKRNWMSQPRRKSIQDQLLAAGLLAPKQGGGNDWTDTGTQWLSGQSPSPTPT
jgi:hypothetical protein